MIKTLLMKDFKLYFRNQLFAVITGLSIVLYLAIYFLMPNNVDDTVNVLIYSSAAIPPVFAQEFAGRDIEVQVVSESEAALKTAVLDKEAVAGIVLPDNALDTLASGDALDIPVYFPPDEPQDVVNAFSTVFLMAFNNIAYIMHGEPLNISVTEEVLGPNLVGQQVAPRDKMLPLFAVMILMTETLGLANLITEERVGRTLPALLMTRMKLRDLFAGKGIFGVGLAFVQVILITAVTGGLAREPLLIMLTLLLGALLATGIGFLIASAAKDFMSVIGWGMLAFIVLALSSFSAIAPSLVTNWIKLIPSFYVVDTMNLVMNFNAGWVDVWQNLVILLVVSMALFWMGIVVLRRKLQ
ncbi:MAG: ABC transporter permease [Anaerolineales bacterium]|nr:ABC transporter permease [Anaerolineales bacterium]